MPLQFLSMGLFTANAAESLYSKLDVPVLVLFDKDPNVSFDCLRNLRQILHGNLSG